jgi:hypothetical protein
MHQHRDRQGQYATEHERQDIFLSNSLPQKPLAPNATMPAPTIAPVKAWVVETGRPLQEATSTHRTAPASTAAASMGDAAVSGASRP